MISFNSSMYYKTKNGGIYLRYDDIEALTEKLIFDYDKSLLRLPHAIEYDDFLESYLGVNLQYYDIYTPDSSELVLGCSIFNKQKIRVFDKEKMKTAYVNCDPNTVILDNCVASGDRIVQENITGLHEGGHIWLHKGQYVEIEGQLSLEGVGGIICCRKTDIEDAGRLDKVHPSNAEMWREWQANVFAVTMALPRRSLDISVKELFEKYGVDTGLLVYDADSGAENLATHVIPNELKSIYNMSKESIRYRLMKTGFYISKKKYEEEQANKQLSLFDFIK